MLVVADVNTEAKTYKETVVCVNRVAKVVKGGKRFSFSALVIVGDGLGNVSAGMGKAKEVQAAVQKAVRKAKRELITVPLKGTTIPHEIIAKHGASKILLKPAAHGTGIIAGGAVRAVLEAAGYKDMLTKSLGNNNPLNVVYATLNALSSLQTKEEVEEIRKNKMHNA